MTENKDIYDLEKEFQKIPSGYNFEVIQFYEKNKEFIDALDTLDSLDNFRIVLLFKANYGISLVKYYPKLNRLNILKDAIDIYDSASIKQLEVFKYPELYAEMLFCYGKGLYEINNYILSSKVFKKLTILFPTRRLYKTWFIASNRYKYNYLINAGAAIIVMIFIIENFFKDSFTNNFINVISIVRYILCFSIIIHALFFYILKKNNEN